MLDGSLDVDQAIRQVDGLDVLVVGEPMPDLADRLQSTAFDGVLDEILASHDLVVLAAAGLDSELVALGSRCAATVVAVDAGRTRRAELRETVAHLRRSRTQVLASVLLR